jgi:hypothetical protein
MDVMSVVIASHVPHMDRMSWDCQMATYVTRLKPMITPYVASLIDHVNQVTCLRTCLTHLFYYLFSVEKVNRICSEERPKFQSAFLLKKHPPIRTRNSTLCHGPVISTRLLFKKTMLIAHTKETDTFTYSIGMNPITNNSNL